MRAACLLLILASARSRDSLETILARIDPPTFPWRDFYVHHYGAVPDGSTDALEGFRLAIAAARDTGGTSCRRQRAAERRGGGTAKGTREAIPGRLA